MREIIGWLLQIEKVSEEFYRDAASYFSDKKFNEFLEHFARDEALHFKILADAADAIDAQSKISSAFVIDQEIRNAVEGPFQKNLERLNARRLTELQIIDCVVETEFSEWNDIFTYVVNSIKVIKPQFKSAAAAIQNHLWQVEQFLATTAYGQEKIKMIQNLQPVWEEKILIVEDDPAVSELLVAVLSGEGVVDTAANGKIALDKIRKQYYRLVISDIDMPVMDGMALFRRAVAEFKHIDRRFLFLTGHPAGPVVEFFKANNLKYLTKPANINAIRQHAVSAMRSITGH